MTNKTYGPLVTGNAGGKPKPATTLKRKVVTGTNKGKSFHPLSGYTTVYIDADKKK